MGKKKAIDFIAKKVTAELRLQVQRYPNLDPSGDNYTEIGLVQGNIVLAWQDALEAIKSGDKVAQQASCELLVGLLAPWHKLSYEYAFSLGNAPIPLAYARVTDYIHSKQRLLGEMLELNEGQKPCCPLCDDC